MNEEDWNFDFSIYEGEDTEEEAVESIVQSKRPPVTGLRSRFSLGEAELQRIAELKKLTSRYAILTEERTQEHSALWKLYAVLSEIWEIIRNIYGEVINQEVIHIKKTCRKLLEDHQSEKIPSKVHNNLLYFRSQLYRIMQVSNLGFEVERSGRSAFSAARRKIEE